MKIIKEKMNPNTDKPYDKIMACVKKDLRISGDAFRLWVTLYTCAETFEPTEASLAVQFGVKVLTIKRWIKELKKYGYMTITGSKEGGYYWSINKYSKGIIDIKNEKFIPKKYSTKVSNMIPSKVSYMLPIIKIMSAPVTDGSAPIINKDLSEQIEEVNLVVGDVSLSSCASFGRTQTLHTPTVVELSGNTASDTIPKVTHNNTPTNFGERSEQAKKNPTKTLVDDTPNDLQFLIDNSTIFQSSYDYAIMKGNNWSECDISTYTNDYIALAVVKRLKGTPIEDIPSHTPSNTYNLLTTMVKFAKKIDSKLWQEFLIACDNDPKIIAKLNTI